jgi:triacylglycerol lipase
MFFFNPAAIAYSPLNAVGLAQAAALSYSDQPLCSATADRWNFPRCQFIERNNIQAIIMGNDEVILLAFRGTDARCIKDWMTDLNASKVREGGGLVHRGFYLGLEAIWLDILMNLQNFRTRKQPLFVTGHSLGGALATLASARLKTFGYDVQGLYTFGSPRVGDRDFFERFSATFPNNAFRFVNNNDVVTRVAPRSMGYKHVGQCLFFDADGRLHVEVDAWTKFLENVQGSMDNFLNDWGLVSDHDMAKYQNHLVLNMSDLRVLQPNWGQAPTRVVSQLGDRLAG